MLKFIYYISNYKVNYIKYRAKQINPTNQIKQSQMSFFSPQFLCQLKQKKKQISKSLHSRFNLQQIQNRIQSPQIKIQKQRLIITQQDFISLVKETKQKIHQQPTLLKLQGPIIVATGTLGSYYQLSMIFQKCGYPKFYNYLFLGDYTGKYQRNIQCLTALMIYKLKMPYNFFLLRGCYETLQMAQNHNLYQQIVQYFGSTKPWLELCELFCCLPFAATINDKIFCVHGGINQYLMSLQQINSIKRPYDTPQKDLPCDLVFSSLNYQTKGFFHSQNLKGISFGQQLVQNFLKRTNLRLICRSHQIPLLGFQYIFNRTVLTICSLSNYLQIYNNFSSVMIVDQQFGITTKQIISDHFSQTEENQQGLTFQQIMENRTNKKIRLEQLEREQQQLLRENQIKKETNQKQKLQRQLIKKQKQQRKRIKKLKKQLQKQQKHKDQSQKIDQKLNQIK